MARLMLRHVIDIYSG